MWATLDGVFAALSWPALTLVVVCILFAGFLRGFVGFGAALIIIMVLSVVFGPVVAVPVAVLSGVPSTLQLLPAAVRHAERSFVVPFAVASIAAAPVGAWILVTSDPSAIRILISLFVLSMVVLLQRGWRLSRQPGPGLMGGAGVVAGLIQGAAGVSGPLAVALALSRPGEPHRQRANVIGTVTALTVCSVVPFIFLGLFTLEVIVIGLAVMPLYSGSTWLGARLFTEPNQRFFRPVALAALAAIGVVTLILAIGDAATTG
jgi:uncharacterized protein